MFKKVLIAEDHEGLNISVRTTLRDLGVVQDSRDYVFYCDDALSRVKKAIRENQPYELLITDLSFVEDDRTQEISTGMELIKAVKQIQADIKILVFSLDDRSTTANLLFADFGIDAYVPKGRRDATDLKIAIEKIYNNKLYSSPNLKQVIKEERAYEFTPLEKTIVSLISQGRSQKEISGYLEQNEIKPSSLSSVEKSINHLKIALNVSTPAQLIAYCKDKQII